MEEKFTITGGIIFALLTEIMITSPRSQNMNVSDSQHLKKCTQSKLFAYLAGIAGDKYHKEENKKNTVSSYKKCTSHGANGLNEPNYKKSFDILVTNNYDLAIKRTEELFKECIFNDEEKRTEFAKRLYWLVKNIESPEKFKFHYNGKICKINEFIKMKKYDFIPFFLSIWHAISTTNQDNTLGETTFNQLFKNDKANSEYRFNCSRYQAPNEVTFNNVLNNEEALNNTELNMIDTSYYQTYINKAVEKLRKIKTILYRNPSVNFYDIYVCNDVKLETNELNPKSKNNDKLISATPKKLIDKYGKAMTLSAPGGTGKSMFLRHMMLCENMFKDKPQIEKTGLIPVLLNLRKYSSNYSDIDDFIIKTLQTYDSNLEKQVILSDFKEGKFLFLFDALDEIQIDLLNDFISKFETFTTQYDSNVFILSSRPNNICSSLNNFTSLTLSELSEYQAKKMIKKLPNIEQEKKDNFNKIVFESSMYLSPTRIESSPLLLTIKFLIYIKTAKILGDKDYEFYEKAYEVLYKNHDEIHNKFPSRSFRTHLNFDEMKEAISEFSFLMYIEKNLSFSIQEINNVIYKMNSAKKYNIRTSAFIYDLKDNLSLLVYDNNEYSFIHKRFMEFFAGNFISIQNDAVFFNELTTILENSMFISYGTTLHYTFVSYIITFAYHLNSELLEGFMFFNILTKSLENISNVYDYVSKFYCSLTYVDNDESYLDNVANNKAILYILENILNLNCYHVLRNWPLLPNLIFGYNYENDNGSVYIDKKKHNDEQPMQTIYKLKTVGFNSDNKSSAIFRPYIKKEFTDEYEALLKYYNSLKEKYTD